MVLIPAGEFLMGAPAGTDGLPDEQPQRAIFLGSVYLDRQEVTNEAYFAFVSAAKHRMPENNNPASTLWNNQMPMPGIERHPVVNVSWTDADAYCRWVGKRLPTEAEWEKAARGTDARRYPWGNGIEPIKHRIKTNELRTAGNGTEPVGSQSAILSPYGISGMVGSVSEWVKDWYSEDFYQVSPVQDPQGPLRGSFRVLRGGELSERSSEHHVSYRSWDEMTYWGPTLGFRCAMDVP